MSYSRQSIKVPLVFSFLIMTFTLCFYHQLWVKWVCIHMVIVPNILGKLIHDSRNVCERLTLSEMHIQLVSLMICSINYYFTNTSSTAPPEVKITYSKFKNIIKFT